MSKSNTNNVVDFRPKPNNHLTSHEVLSVNALMSYVAQGLSISRAVVEATFTMAFAIDKIEHLQRKEFENAIKYLVSLRIDMLKKPRTLAPTNTSCLDRETSTTNPNLTYKNLVERHGEFGAHVILERLEMYCGVAHEDDNLDAGDRFDRLMDMANEASQKH